jgi:LytS/YehU family sensor histidine kinase
LKSENTFFEQPYLPPGKYRFVVQARKHGLVNDELSLQIDVPLSLMENTWFWSFLVGTIVFGIGGFFYYRTIQDKKAAQAQLALQQLKSEKEQLQVQTIISSFNPHFINNSLHWVQSRYRKDNELVRVVGRLSENIHTIFKNTRQQKAHHTLEEELRIVDNYIAIQQIRFSDTFTFEKVISPDVNIREVEVFLLQIQIHVENAIEHGIRNKEGSSMLRLSISAEDAFIKITIEDDGIGRPAASKMMSRGTQSGTKMLGDLQAIFNEKNRVKMRREYEDEIFTDVHGSKYGTRVILYIPKTYHYEI